MRLTEKNNVHYDIKKYEALCVAGDAWNYYDAVDKLGKLEDIEEKLGVDLITYFHFLFGKPVFLKDSTGKIQEITNTGWRYHPFRKSFIWFHKGMEKIQLFIKGYGKTWALTKEELEK